MLGWTVIGSCAVGVLGYSLFIWRYNAEALKQQRKVFQARKQSSIDAWYTCSFFNTGLPLDEIVRLLQPVAKAMKCDVTQLRPDDSFDGTLRFRGWSWLGVADDDPLAEFAESDLVQILGNEERVEKVIGLMEANPTLLELVYAIARTGTSDESRK